MAPNRNPLESVYDPFDDVPARQIDAPPPPRTMSQVAERMATPRGLGPRIVPPKDDQLVIHDDGTMEYGPFRLTEVGMVATRDFSTQEWTKLGRFLKRFEAPIAWMIGDWFNSGEAKWGVSYALVAQEFEYQIDTLYAYAWVARNVQFLIRIKNLSFAHHRAVAGFEDAELQRAWLEKAADEGWKLDRFKTEMFGTKTATLPADVKAYRKRERQLAQHFAGKKTLPLTDAERAIQDQMRYWAERLELVRRQMAAQADALEADQP